MFFISQSGCLRGSPVNWMSWPQNPLKGDSAHIPVYFLRLPQKLCVHTSLAVTPQFFHDVIPTSLSFFPWDDGWMDVLSDEHPPDLPPLNMHIDCKQTRRVILEAFSPDWGCLLHQFQTLCWPQNPCYTTGLYRLTVFPRWEFTEYKSATSDTFAGLN